MTGRFIVIIIDGFGIGAMADAASVRPGDEKADTFGSILRDFPDLRLPTLERLGLMNAYGRESRNMKFSRTANFGASELQHWGADTFMGHQEIMGTLPRKPYIHPIQESVSAIKAYLENNGHKAEILTDRKGGPLRFLLVDDYCTVADNIDSDPGMAVNCTAPLDFMPFEKALEIARLVRQVVQVSRVIVFGGTGNTLEDLLAAVETRQGKYIGVLAARSKSYDQGYMCRHLGYGVDGETQVPAILARNGIGCTLIGKVADIVHNENGKSISCVPTEEVLRITRQEIRQMEKGFICANIQETDLAGHAQDPRRYKDLLELADRKIGELLTELNGEDILLVQADHGNDPDIGHNRHTREKVPMLIYRKGMQGMRIGLRKTLSDTGASVCSYFHTEAPENGTSFLRLPGQ